MFAAGKSPIIRGPWPTAVPAPKLSGARDLSEQSWTPDEQRGRGEKTVATRHVQRNGLCTCCRVWYFILYYYNILYIFLKLSLCSQSLTSACAFLGRWILAQRLKNVDNTGIRPKVLEPRRSTLSIQNSDSFMTQGSSVTHNQERAPVCKLNLLLSSFFSVYSLSASSSIILSSLPAHSPSFRPLHHRRHLQILPPCVWFFPRVSWWCVK